METTLKVRVAVPILVALCLAACETPPPVPIKAEQPLNDAERSGLALLLVGPNENVVKTCAVISFKLNAGLTMMRMGKASDDQVVKDLVAATNAKDKDYPALRDRQASVWRETHDPSRVAILEFEYCQRIAGVTARLGPLGKTCFSTLAVPAMSEGYKSLRYSRERATNELLGAFQSQMPADFLTRVVADVYSKDAAATQYEVHRQVFAACIRDTR